MFVISLCGGGRGGWGFLDGVEFGALATSVGGGLAWMRWGVTKSMKYSILQGFTAMVRMGDSIGNGACAGEDRGEGEDASDHASRLGKCHFW